MERFVGDDDGYVDWLAAHPRGFVLNTYAHVTSDYLILHRAACWTINRPLTPERSWTALYGKACSDDRAELEAWADRTTRGALKPCGHCLRDELEAGIGTRPPVGASGRRGSRAPRAKDFGVEFDGAGIALTVRPSGSAPRGAPSLTIEGAQWLAETFFRRDPSAVGPGSYDARIDETQRDPDLISRIVDDDVTAINRTMAARSSHEAWASAIQAQQWGWLETLDPEWDLIELDDDDWARHDVSRRLRTAFAALQRPRLGIAVITKLLHIKRPRLIPVLDSLVIDQVGARVSSNVDSWVEALKHVRAVGRENHDALIAIRLHLNDRGIEGRSLVRILDALLWAGSPGSGLFRYLDGWERVLRPRNPGR